MDAIGSLQHRPAAAAAAARARPAGRALTPPMRRALAAFLLGCALPLYLAIRGGGYEPVLRDEVGIALWWVAIAGLLAGVLPLARPSRAQIGALAALMLLAAWSGLGALWSLGPGDSVAVLSQLSAYAAILAVGILTVRADTRQALIAGLLCAIAALAALSLLSRLDPGLLGADQTAAFLAGAKSRLNWPLNYWNALAAFMAIGMPLAVHFATAARRIAGRALAAAAMPLLAAVIYLTLSRGGWLELAVGLLALVALSPRRLWRLATIANGALGSALLILAIHQRPLITQGATRAAAARQGGGLILIAIVVCAGVALLQAAIGLIERDRGGARRALRPPSRLRAIPAPALLAGGVAVAAVAFVAAGGPAEVAHLWRHFENPAMHLAAGKGNTEARLLSASGDGRWQYWLACMAAFTSHPFGIGAGTFQLWWMAHGSIYSYVLNAHSLYFETLAETGLPGILLLAAFLATGLAGTLRRLRAAPAGDRLLARGWTDEHGRGPLRPAGAERSALAAIFAACLAFWCAATFDWVWQIPALPALLLLLLAAGLAGSGGTRRAARAAAAREGASEDGGGPPSGAVAGRGGRLRAAGGRRRGRLALAVTVAVAAIAAAAIAWPMAAQVSLRQSRTAVAAGQLRSAMGDARSSARLQSFASAPPLQQALILERSHRLPAAAAAARRAIVNAPTDWRSWLILSRIEAERGRPAAALAAWRHARSLDPHDPLFRTGA